MYMDTYRNSVIFVLFRFLSGAGGCEWNTTECCCKCSSVNCGALSTDSYLMIPPDYKSNFASVAQKGAQEPFTLSVNMEVWAINEMSLQKQEIEVDMKVGVEWFDYRLNLSPESPTDRTRLRLKKHDVKRIWKPTLIFRNCKECQPLSFFDKPNTGLFIERKTKLLVAKYRVLERFTCTINLRAYPMDIQTCILKLYVLQDTNSALRLNHTYPKQLTTILSNHTLSEFHVLPMTKSSCTFEDDNEVHPCLELRIRLEHLVAYHLMSLYAPTCLIVILSWIAFWLPVDMAPARIALALISLLILATRLDQAQKDLPPVAYLKAIDVWIFACFFLVTASMFEFAISHQRWRAKNSAETVSESKAEVRLPTPKPNSTTLSRRNTYNVIRPFLARKEAVAASSAPPSPTHATKRKEDTTVDRISRIVFPLSFIIFNTVYWSCYLTYRNT